MIRVLAASEPADFNRDVRLPGLAYLQSLPSVDDAKTSRHPYWRKVLGQLHSSYGGICAYSCHWIPYDVGNDTVEHFVPKSVYPSLAYEWSNYRLVSGRYNGRKRDFQDVVDPFDVVPGMFLLDFPSLFVVVGENLTTSQRMMAASTINRLQLNEGKSVNMRMHFIESLLKEQINEEYVAAHAPFLFSELQRLELDTDKLKILFG